MIKVLEIYRLTFLYFIEKMLKIWESWSELGGCWLRTHKRPSRKSARAPLATGKPHPRGRRAQRTAQHTPTGLLRKRTVCWTLRRWRGKWTLCRGFSRPLWDREHISLSNSLADPTRHSHTIPLLTAHFQDRTCCIFRHIHNSWPWPLNFSTFYDILWAFLYSMSF